MSNAGDRVIYLDNNATTMTAPEVVRAMLPYFSEYYGNASSIHHFGGNLAKVIEEARAKVAFFLGADLSEVIFTSCGTESDSSAILSGITTNPLRKKIVVSAVEHPAVLNLVKDLSLHGYLVDKIPVDEYGRIDMNAAEYMIDDNTAIVSVMWANNETGNIHPIEKLSELAHKHGALFHTDAVQAAGKIRFSLHENPNIDLLSISGHKFHAPKGIGALYVRRGVRFHPFVIGGHQERGRRAGTENIPYIVAMGTAAELAVSHWNDENTFVRKLRDDLQNRLLAAIPAVKINGDQENRLPNTTNLSFQYIEGESILMHMDMYGICASSGSACTTGSLEPSHVLRAMNVPYTAAHGAIRFSFSRYNTQDDVDVVIQVMPGIIEKIRMISPYWKS